VNDPLVYPIAQAFIPYRSPIKITGGLAAPCDLEKANGEALDSSYNGDTTGYEAGSVVRARFLPEKAE